MFIYPIISGAIAMASLVIALFFLRFWKSTQDRFFLFFAISFTLEACSRLLLALSAYQNESAPLYYLIRLVGYSLILVAIVDKNTRSATDKHRR